MKQNKCKIVTKSCARPAGKPDRCFYCGRKIGKLHKYECVCNDHKVKVSYSFDIEVMFPKSWSKEDIEFHRNEGTWCADNAINELVKVAEKESCLCGCFKCKVLSIPKGKK